MAKHHFLDGLDPDLKKSLLQELRILWAHTSTALEGNSLTLGETHQVLTEGLTINGKPLKDHNEVMGHARAEDLMEDLINKDEKIKEEHIFELHKAIQSNITNDVYEPIGAWKNESNSTIVVIDEKQIPNDTYAKPEDVPTLMTDWLKELNSRREKNQNEDQALANYSWLHAAFVRVHPFADGNGRLARLLSNIPVLSSGFPPLIIEMKKRGSYIRKLARWQLAIGRPQVNKPLVVENTEYKEFETFCSRAWQPSQTLVKNIQELQKKRKGN